MTLRYMEAKVRPTTHQCHDTQAVQHVRNSQGECKAFLQGSRLTDPFCLCLNPTLFLASLLLASLLQSG